MTIREFDLFFEKGVRSFETFDFGGIKAFSVFAGEEPGIVVDVLAVALRAAHPFGDVVEGCCGGGGGGC